MRVVLFIIEYMPPVLLIPRPSSRVITEFYCAYKSNKIKYNSILTMPDNHNPQTPLRPLSFNTPFPTPTSSGNPRQYDGIVPSGLGTPTQSNGQL